MSKHTPGPWLTTESTEHWGRVNVTVQAAFTANEIATAWQGTTDVNRANARLIAAAPDLLEALRCADTFITNGIELGFIRMPDADTPDPAHKTLAIVRAAIAKATGEKA
jgi:hypothetical protein